MRCPTMLVLLACSSASAAWQRAPLASRRRVAPLLPTMVATTSDSGLVYEELSAGAGKSPALGDVVKVMYKGELQDGTVFDSSYSRGEPTEFKLESVIVGWQQGLQMMKEGGKARLTIPPALAYGSKQVNLIPPDSTLTFEVELLEVLAAEEALIPTDYLTRSLQSARSAPRGEPTEVAPDTPADTITKVALAVMFVSFVLGAVAPDLVAQANGLSSRG